MPLILVFVGLVIALVHGLAIALVLPALAGTAEARVRGAWEGVVFCLYPMIIATVAVRAVGGPVARLVAMGGAVAVAHAIVIGLVIPGAVEWANTIRGLWEAFVFGVYPIVLAGAAMNLTRVSPATAAAAPQRTGIAVLQLLGLAGFLFLALRLAQYVVNALLTELYGLAQEGLITLSPLGEHYITHTLAGAMTVAILGPLLVFLVSRVTRKIGRNPGFWSFCLVSVLVVFASVFANYARVDDLAGAFVATLAPPLGLPPDAPVGRAAPAILVFQLAGLIGVSFLLALAMWAIAGVRTAVAPAFERWGI